MKKLLATIFAIATALTVLAVAGCNSAAVKKTNIDDKPCYVFTATGIDTQSDVTVADYLTSLKEKGEINFEGYTGEYGLYITSVDGLKESFSEDYSSGSYWSIYIDFITLDGDSAIYSSDTDICEYQGKTYYYANYGFSGLPCVEGHTYILAYVSY